MLCGEHQKWLIRVYLCKVIGVDRFWLLSSFGLIKGMLPDVLEKIKIEHYNSTIYDCHACKTQLCIKNIWYNCVIYEYIF